VLRRGYSILFHFILSLCVFLVCCNAVRDGWVHLPGEQTGKPDHLSFT
jgi:hypothetical protein